MIFDYRNFLFDWSLIGGTTTDPMLLDATYSFTESRSLIKFDNSETTNSTSFCRKEDGKYALTFTKLVVTGKSAIFLKR